MITHSATTDGEALLGKIRDVCHENKLEKTENNDYS